ncbi:sigma-54-dependent transcriptional regulator [Limnoglobus roseus]|uniref:DNA-binding transcriptional regulator NtrC n=1 Tax=Limnoglobus roseus TaxID=2598579 RepID=A0A5C1ALN5_9BACT|nr:sigma-54 dependent transcriptional regulator [Limnoglobus roseus]QEL18084.1 sigma-54-dependent Fis family transcriptional regulator [Limnoglobus roseus]
MANILLVDDEASIQHAFRRAFRDADVTLTTASTSGEAAAAFEANRPDVVVLDIHLPDSTGLDTFHRLHAIDARIPIVLITGHGTTELAIAAMKEGAFDFLLKPLELADVRELVNRAIRSSQLMRVPASLPEIESRSTQGDLLLGRCPAMQDVYKAIGRVAATDATSLILGESGTGKELVARAIYQHSRRSQQPFLAVNCGAIPENLLESELFGHERGAFTGADRKRIGKFEQASGGTIFLDEVGELPLIAQVKMLRVLQEQRFERVGGNELVQTDVRVIAATNVDLEKSVQEGRFRKDLFFRLNVFSITLPPLRDRGDDLPLLVEYYIHRYAASLGSPVQQVTPEALEVLRAYPWPGNVRELQSILKQALLHARGPVLLADFLPAQVLTRPAATSGGGARFDWDTFVNERIAAGSETLYAESLARMEREILIRILQHTNGNQLQAARILGITRGSLRNKIRLLGINIGREVWSANDQPDS